MDGSFTPFSRLAVVNTASNLIHVSYPGQEVDGLGLIRRSKAGHLCLEFRIVRTDSFPWSLYESDLWTGSQWIPPSVATVPVDLWFILWASGEQAWSLVAPLAPRVLRSPYRI
jgi:hypothetical protein